MIVSYKNKKLFDKVRKSVKVESSKGGSPPPPDNENEN